MTNSYSIATCYYSNSVNGVSERIVYGHKKSRRKAVDERVKVLSDASDRTKYRFDTEFSVMYESATSGGDSVEDVKLLKILNRLIKCYDVGESSTVDRYTAVYIDSPMSYDSSGGAITFEGLSMSGSPNHPLGVGMHTEVVLGRHLGKRIKIEDLPYGCRCLILSGLKDWLVGGR